MADDRWIPDPQGRADVEKVSRFLKLPVWKGSTLGDFRRFWNELWAKIDENAETTNQTISNYCPYRVGDILESTNPQNPSKHWIGTEWKQITEITKGVPLRETAGVVLGSNDIYILRTNLPKDKIKTEEHTHTNAPHSHQLAGNAIHWTLGGGGGADAYNSKGMRSTTSVSIDIGSSAPYTEPLGDGTPITITPKHYTVYKWERTK